MAKPDPRAELVKEIATLIAMVEFNVDAPDFRDIRAATLIVKAIELSGRTNRERAERREDRAKG
jgi:hypothetical protein